MSFESIDDSTELVPLFSLDDAQEQDQGKREVYPSRLALLALKNTLLFPGVIVPITVGRSKSLKAVERAQSQDNFIAVTAQRSVDIEDPQADDLFPLGVLAKIVRVMRMPEGEITILLQGRERIELSEIQEEQGCLVSQVQSRPDLALLDPNRYQALITALRSTSEQIIKNSPHLPDEAILALDKITNPDFLVHFIAAHMNANLEAKQLILQEDQPENRAESVLKILVQELDGLKVRSEIEGKVRGELEKQQRDYVLNQQLKTIQDELGQNPQQQDLDELEARAQNKNWPQAAADKFDKEFKRLKRTNPMAPDYTITLNHLELMLDLPWDDCSEDNFDLDTAEATLEEDHFGLEKIKERILDYLAVLQLRQDMKAPILCLVGPPGVGKTSLGKSIAAALKRHYVRMSLGGLHDEAELRGHRKTYIGAMPGRIIQSLKKAGSSNPVFILDELDKLGNSFRGDPSSALLEVLDPEQNTSFYDNYLEVEYDLSKVLFIATANSLNTIQPALLDRMEIIELSGYSVEEKVEIAKRHLLPQQKQAHGLPEDCLELSPDLLPYLAERYTRESGVRSLNRVLGSIMRHLARKVAKNPQHRQTLQIQDLEGILGPEKVNPDAYEADAPAGVAVGLAWTQVGGDILFIEALLSAGKGKLELTGNLGQVMKESASTALSFLRNQAESLGLKAEDFSSQDIHLHIPAGAIPKDGPSAGITMLTALSSAFTQRKIKPRLAMTGEITLRGRVLPVGGIKEKILAAKRAGMTDIILCEENRRDVQEIPKRYLENLHFHYVRYMKEVLDLALCPA